MATGNYLEKFQQANILKLNVSSVDESKIEEGVKRIVKEINNISRKENYGELTSVPQH